MTTAPIRILGGIGLRGDNGPVAAGSRASQRLLGILVSCSGNAVTARRMEQLLWGYNPPPDPTRALRVAIDRLHRRLAAIGLDDALSCAGNVYRLNVNPLTIDAGQFVTLVGQARAAAFTDPDRAVRLFLVAITLWSGDPFGPLATEPWAQATAHQLIGLRGDVEGELTELQLRRQLPTSLRERFAAKTQPLLAQRWSQLTRTVVQLARPSEVSVTSDALSEHAHCVDG